MNKVDKSKMRNGPWMDEPDYLQFKTKEGYDGVILRTPEIGILCGYVGVPPSHPLHGKDYGDVDVDVHGGLTYSNIGLAKLGENPEFWYFGFDCAHLGDEIPGIYLRFGSDKYRDIEYVQKEVESLSRQLKDKE